MNISIKTNDKVMGVLKSMATWSVRNPAIVIKINLKIMLTIQLFILKMKAIYFFEKYKDENNAVIICQDLREGTFQKTKTNPRNKRVK